MHHRAIAPTDPYWLIAVVVLALVLAPWVRASLEERPRPGQMSGAEMDEIIRARRASGLYDVRPYGRVEPTLAAPIPTTAGPSGIPSPVATTSPSQAAAATT